MLKILRETDDPDLMEQVWSFRHQKFVEDFGWEELRRQDRRERDPYDTADTCHAVLVAGKKVVGYSRLLPTTRPHLTQDFCERLGVRSPVAPAVFEWSRCATAPDAPKINGHAASDVLMTGVLECLMAFQARAVVFLTYQTVVNMMRRRGYPVNNLCSIELPNGEQVEAVASALPADLLIQHRKRHGISGSLLEWGPTAVLDRVEPPAAA